MTAITTKQKLKFIRGGWTTRILEFLISIAALYLPWTGIRQWWIKHKVRKTRKKDFVV